MATTSSPTQLLLLADHLKLSLLERQRAISLKLEVGKDDAQITRSLTSFQEGLEHLETQHFELGEPEDPNSDLSRLRKQYNDLYAKFYGKAPPTPELRRPNNPDLSEDFAAAQSRPSQARRNKSVRFRDNPGEEEEDPVDIANRAALFSDQERYTDEPAGPDQSELSNQFIHEHHKNVLREQDEQLNTLGQSIGRQRVLGISIGNELDEQNELLTDVESGVDRHQSTLDRARTRLGNVARKSKGNGSWITIAILIIVLMLLIIVLK
jgi:syntaxin 8